MQISNNSYTGINRPSQDFQTSSESPLLPPAERAKTEVGQHASISRASPSSFAERTTRRALLAKLHKHAYEVEFLSDLQTIHNQNVDKVHEQVDAFIETFVAEKPDALSTEIRDGISSNLGQILEDAQLDISCYQELADMKAENGKHLIFSSLSVPLLKDAPLCFQLFHSKPEQTTPIHNPLNPAEASPQPVLAECASYVVDVMIDDSIKNPEDNPVTTVHAYPMDGISVDQTVAVQSEFAGFKNPKSAVYSAYDTYVEKVKTGGADRTPIPEIGANNLLEHLKANKFGANPVIVDIRESNEVQRSGALHIEGARILHVPRGVAIAKILADFPDRNTHLVLTCRGHTRSVFLAADLQALGYNSTVVSDGAMGCAKQGLMKAYDADSKTAGKWDEELDLAPPALTEHIRQLKSSIVAMTPEELASGLKEMNLVVFDVRQENERSSGVIPNTQWVPAGEFEKKARFHAHNLNTPIVIYSADDGDYRALIAARNLMEMGYPNVKYLEGGYKNHMDQDVSAASSSSEIYLRTKEIQEEQESPFLSAAASLNHDFVQDLDMALGTKEIQEEQESPLLSSAHDSDEDLQIKNRVKPKMLGDLPDSREILLNSKNLAARTLGIALAAAQTEFKNKKEHYEQCCQIYDAAEMLYGLCDVNDSVLQNLHLDGMTPKDYALTTEEYLSIAADVDVQLHDEHGVAAVFERNSQNSQNARAADRVRYMLMNKTRSTAEKVLSHTFDAAESILSYTAAAIRNPRTRATVAKVRSYTSDAAASILSYSAATIRNPKKRATAAKALSHISDAAASSLSYSVAAISNPSLYRRSMASGATWSFAAVLNSISRASSPQNQTVAGFVSDATNFGAAIASMVATAMSHQSKDQNKVNLAVNYSNALWMTSAAGAFGSGIQAILNGRKLANPHGMSALAYAASGLGLAGDAANFASAQAGIASTTMSDGGNVTLNKLSAELWMAGTALGTASTLLGKWNESRQEREANRLREIELSEIELSVP